MSDTGRCTYQYKPFGIFSFNILNWKFTNETKNSGKYIKLKTI